MFAALKPIISGGRPGHLPRGGAVRRPDEPLQNFPGLRRAARDRALDRVDGLGRVHHRLQPQRSTRASTGLVRTADAARVQRRPPRRHLPYGRERRQPVILTTDDGVRVGIVAGTYGLNGFALPEDQRVGGLDVGRRQPARPGRARAAGGRRHRGRPRARRRRVLPPAERRAGRAGPPPHRLPGRRPGARRARARRPADHPGQRQVGRLRDGQHDRPAATLPSAYLRGHHRPVRVPRGARRPVPGDRRGVRPDVLVGYSPGNPIRIHRVVAGLASGRGDVARLREARAEIREAVGGLGWPRGLRER